MRKRERVRVSGSGFKMGEIDFKRERIIKGINEGLCN